MSDGAKFLIFLLVVFGLGLLLIGPQAGTALIGAGDALQAERAQGTQNAVVYGTQQAILDLTRAAPTPDFGATQTAIQGQAALDALDVERAQGVATLEAQQTAFAIAVAQTATVQALLIVQDGATATAQSAGATATAEYEYGIVQRQQELARIEWQNTVRTVAWIIGSAVAVGILGLIGWVIWTRESTRREQGHRMDWHQVQLQHTPTGPRVIVPALMGGPVLALDAKTGTATLQGFAPWELQAQIDLAVQRVRGLAEMAKAYAWYDRMAGHAKELPEVGGPLPMQAGDPGVLPPYAPWRMLDNWMGGALPLGLEASGLLLADMSTSPHLLVAGTSGSGKTRYGLRPISTAALAAGWQVAIFNKTNLDFLPLRDHPNAQLMKLQNGQEAIGYLRALYGEVERRTQVLERAEISTWDRLGSGEGPTVMAVFDEFSNLADSLESKEREELWRWARMIAAEGRKAGIFLAIALQDPTHKSLDLRIRRNCTPVAFRVQDDAASRVVLGTGGAESLPERQFMAVIQARLHQAVAFAPSDEDIRRFLGARDVPALAAPEWLVKGPVEGLNFDPTAEEIRLYAREHSKSETARHFFGYADGAAFRKVQEALDVS
jgi:hypothetical protein